LDAIEQIFDEIPLERYCIRERYDHRDGSSYLDVYDKVRQTWVDQSVYLTEDEIANLPLRPILKDRVHQMNVAFTDYVNTLFYVLTR